MNAMFKKIAIGSLLIGVGMCLGCITNKNVDATGNELESEFISAGYGITSFILTDNETNIQYIVVKNNDDGGVAITPRLDKNGKLYIKNK